MRFPFGGTGDGDPPHRDPCSGPVSPDPPVGPGRQDLRSLPVAAIRHLCELVRRFNQRSFEQVIAFGWGRYPRFARLGLDGLEHKAPEEVRRRCRRALEVAVEELEPHYPPPVDDVSPIGILRRHVLEGDTWDVILTERKEQGLARLSERTLKNRQHEAYRIILRWAEQSSTPLGGQLDLPFHWRAQLLRRAAMAGVLVILLSLSAWGLAHWLRGHGSSTASSEGSPPGSTLASQLRAVDPGHIGVPLLLPGQERPGLPPLKEILPAVRLPALGSEIRWVMLLPGENGAPPDLLLSTRMGGKRESQVFLWNPLTRQLRWRLDWHPPREEIFTHTTLDSSVYNQGWNVGWVLYSSQGMDLGDRIAIGYRQLYSPSFVLLVDRHRGRVLAHYAHPGHISAPILADLSGDGQPEILLPATDNALNRPDLIVLEPDMQTGAASTCIWNHEGEGALFRVLLPSVPELEEQYGVARLWVRSRDLTWSDDRELLLVVVRGDDSPSGAAYGVQLSHGCRPVRGHAVFADDSTWMRWERMGLDPASRFPALEQQIEVVVGRDFDERMGPALSSSASR